MFVFSRIACIVSITESKDLARWSINWSLFRSKEQLIVQNRYGTHGSASWEPHAANPSPVVQWLFSVQVHIRMGQNFGCWIFKGVFRLFQFDTFLIPLKKQDFGWKMKLRHWAALSWQVELKWNCRNESLRPVPVSYQERVELNEAIRGIQTPPTSEKPRKRKFSV